MQVGGSGGTDDLNSEINVTPLVDVMLVLLVIFMITAPMLNTGVDVNLPQAPAQELDQADGKPILSIDRERRLRLGERALTWVTLQDVLQSDSKVQAGQELYIEADEALPYGVVVTAMATAKSAGVEKVMMLTDPSGQRPLAELDQPASSNAPAAQGTAADDE